MALNSISMSFAVSGCGMTIDQEHQRIMRELRAYGVEPTGEKSVDKAKLQQINAAKDSQNAQFSNPKEGEEKPDTASKNEVVDKGEGTNQLAMLNRLKFGLL